MNAMPERVSCPCDYRIKNLVRVNVPKIGEQLGEQLGEQEPKIEEQKMNREMNDKIIEFYIQVADELCAGRDWCVSGIDDPLRRFAALVAAAERKACAKLAETPMYRHEIAEKIRARGQE
jgi:hypothetical protein